MSEEVIDIGSSREGPAGRLSNFTERSFVFRGVECASIEGVLQAVKFEDANEQRRVCGLAGLGAKRAGRVRDEVWQAKGALWWQGVVIPRGSVEYQQLLDELFVQVAEQCPDFREDLTATGEAGLVHSIGKSENSKTVLTEDEFCWRLSYLRRAILAGLLKSCT